MSAFQLVNIWTEWMCLHLLPNTLNCQFEGEFSWNYENGVQIETALPAAYTTGLHWHHHPDVLRRALFACEKAAGPIKVSA